MSDYDFSSLNDKEFESLSTDILSAHYNTRIERFKGGKDGGVDGRFFSSNNKEAIVQCKHWLKSGLPKLLLSLEKSEASKVEKLNPSKYIFVTSLELSRVNKAKIKSVFYPYIKSEQDIWGKEDLNDVLAKHSNIENKHYKLWITSTAVLNRIFNSAIVGRSQSKIQEIAENSPKYVITQSHKEAYTILEQLQTVIIKGSPGVGKTTLADQLCQYYVANDFELCFIENSLNEAESVYVSNKKQLFYFDDFLGRNFLLALEQHQDSHIVNFIKRVKKDKSKRFILTTRSNILNQGHRLCDTFEINQIDRNEYEVSVSNLTKLDKAKILYNHIWFSSLEDSYIDEIYKNNRYLKIIGHRNFNPRLISFITDSHLLSNVKDNEYWSYIEGRLNNPKGVWQKVLEADIDDISRHVVIAVAVHGGAIDETELQLFYKRLKGSKLNANNTKRFEEVMRLLTGALLNRNLSGNNKVYYNLFNPSIADFVLSSYFDDIDYINNLLSCLRTPQSIKNIRSLVPTNTINETDCSDLISKQLTEIFLTEDEVKFDEYLQEVILLMSTIGTTTSLHLTYLTKVAEMLLSKDSKRPSVKIFSIILYFTRIGVINIQSKEYKDKVSDWASCSINMDEHKPLSSIIADVEPQEAELTETFKDSVVELFCDSITEDIIENGILEDMYSDDYFVGLKVDDFVEKTLSELNINFDSNEVDVIVDACDFEVIIEYNIDASSGYFDDSDGERFYEDNEDSGENSEVSLINDLFDRS